MNEKETIITWCKQMDVAFDGINLIYAYNKILETHLVEVTPVEIEQSKEFAKEARLEINEIFFPLNNAIFMITK
jgi:hypothetical protein